MDKEKVYKKGTKVKLKCWSDTWPSLDDSDVIILDADTTVKELNEMAKHFMFESIQPTWDFEVIK